MAVVVADHQILQLYGTTLTVSERLKLVLLGARIHDLHLKGKENLKLLPINRENQGDILDSPDVGGFLNTSCSLEPKTLTL